MNEIDKLALTELARDSIKAKLENRNPDTSKATQLSEEKGVFVTILKRRNLRGGMGVIKGKPLYKALIEAAQKAAFEDPRFSPLEKREVESIKIEIAVLNDMEKLEGNPTTFPDKIEPGKHGLLIEGQGNALLLPKAGRGQTSLQFLNALSQAAELSFSSWQDSNNKVYKFTAENFSE